MTRSEKYEKRSHAHTQMNLHLRRKTIPLDIYTINFPGFKKNLKRAGEGKSQY